MLSSPHTQKRRLRNLTTRLQHEARITHVDFVRNYWVPNRSGWAHDSYRTTGDRGSSSTNREMGKAGQRLLSRTSTASIIMGTFELINAIGSLVGGGLLTI